MSNIDYSVTIDENLLIVPESIKNSSFIVSGDEKSDELKIQCLNKSITYASISFRRKDGAKFGDFAMTPIVGGFKYNFSDRRVLAIPGELKFSLKLYELKTETIDGTDIEIKKVKATPELGLFVRKAVGDSELVVAKDSIIIELQDEIAGSFSEIKEGIEEISAKEDTNRNTIDEHIDNRNNPHNVTASQVKSNYNAGAGDYTSNVEDELKAIKTKVNNSHENRIETLEYEVNNNEDGLKLKTQDIYHEDAHTVLKDVKINDSEINLCDIDKAAITGSTASGLNMTQPKISQMGEGNDAGTNIGYVEQRLTTVKSEILETLEESILDYKETVDAMSKNHVINIEPVYDTLNGELQFKLSFENSDPKYTDSINLVEKLAFINAYEILDDDGVTTGIRFELANKEYVDIDLSDISTILSSKLVNWEITMTQLQSDTQALAIRVNNKLTDVDTAIRSITDAQVIMESAEAVRVSNEEIRIANENTRKIAEEARVREFEENERTRYDEVESRLSTYDSQYNEIKNQATEAVSDLETIKDNLDNAEEERVNAERVREVNESLRISNERYRQEEFDKLQAKINALGGVEEVNITYEQEDFTKTPEGYLTTSSFGNENIVEGSKAVVEKLKGNSIVSNEVNKIMLGGLSLKSKNLFSGGDVEGVSVKSVVLNEIPSGNYTISADIVSSDTDSNACLITFYKGSNAVQSITINRGARVSKSFTLSSPIDNCLIYAGSSNLYSQNDSFSFKNVQIEQGETATEYEPYFEGLRDNYAKEIVAKGKNKFNSSFMSSMEWGSSTGQHSLSSDNIFTYNCNANIDYLATNNIVDFVKNLKPNTTYTTYCHIKSVVNDVTKYNSVGSMRACFFLQTNNTFDTSGNKILILGPQNYITLDVQTAGTYEYDVSCTFTTPNDLSIFTHITTRLTLGCSLEFSKMMMVEGTESIPYIPYSSTTHLSNKIVSENSSDITIASKVGSLLGITGNYYDVKNKRFVATMTIQDLGDIDFAYDSGNNRWVANLPLIKAGTARTTFIISEKYDCKYNNEEFEQWTNAIYSNNQNIYVHNNSSTNKPSGFIFYPLATPQIIDCSDVLTDEEIKALTTDIDTLEEGGTLIAKGNYLDTEFTKEELEEKVASKNNISIENGVIKNVLQPTIKSLTPNGDVVEEITIPVDLLAFDEFYKLTDADRIRLNAPANATYVLVRKTYKQDLGELTVNLNSNGGFALSGITIKYSGDTRTTSNIICAKYTTKSLVDLTNSNEGISVFGNGNLWIKDDSCSDANTFKLAMQGVELEYEVTPDNYTYTFYSNNYKYKIVKDGKELIVSDSSPIYTAKYFVKEN